MPGFNLKRRFVQPTRLSVMKGKLILVASILLPFLYIQSYVWNAAGRTVFRDDMYLIKGAVVEKFCEGTLTFADLWRAAAGTRLFGYNLLLVANTAWCGLNSRLVVHLIPFVLLATACLLYRDYRRSLAGLCSPAVIAGTYALPMLLLFNLTLWEGLTFDFAIIFVWSVPWFLASFYALEDLLLNGRRISWLGATLIPGLAVLVFGQTSSFAFVAALAVTFGCYVTLNRRNLPKGFAFRMLAVGAVLGLLVFLYLYRINENDYFSGSWSLDWRIFSNLWNVPLFVFATLAASVAGVDAAKFNLSFASIVVLGSLVALVYAFALILYFRTRMHERTYLPLFMIAYALAYVAFMTVGRFEYGLLYGMASRYTCNTIYGIIAIVWITLFVTAGQASAPKPLGKTLQAAMIFIFAGMSWTAIVEWRTLPFRKEYLEQIPKIAMNVDTANDEELAVFEERPSLVKEALIVLRKNRLNVYRNSLTPPISTATSLIPLISTVKLSLPAGGASSISTWSGPGKVQIGYATLECNAAGVPYGTAVFTLVENNVVVCETAVPASPPTNAARIFVDYRSRVSASTARSDAGSLAINTRLALVNLGPSAAHVTYTLRNRDGATLTTGHGTVESGAQFAKFINQLEDVARDFDIPGDFPTVTRFGSLDIAGDQPLSIAALRQTTNQRNESLFTAALIADLSRPLGNLPVYFPQFVDGGGYATSLVLLNTSNGIETGVFQILDDTGAPLVANQVGGTADSSFRYSIPSGGAFRFQTDGSPTAARVGWVQVTPDAGTSTPVCAEVLSYSPGQILVTEAAVPAAVPTAHARIYMDLSGGHSTALAVANIAKTKVSITIKAFQSDGVTGAGTSRRPIQLAGRGRSAKFAADFITGLSAGYTGVLDLSSSTPFAALTLRSLNNERNDFLMTALPIADADRTSPSPIVFPQIVAGGGYTTELILLNTGSPVAATIKFMGQTGLPLAIVK